MAVKRKKIAVMKTGVYRACHPCMMTLTNSTVMMKMRQPSCSENWRRSSAKERRGESKRSERKQHRKRRPGRKILLWAIPC
ncbi:hypothetical protein DH86_00002377 [Scytalidium sp. 3C]|nr:hypothetical protein DH86_00002377 [Scytalidium sp. 3C]